MIDSESKMHNFITKMSYIVIFPDEKIELFKSLRDIQKAISVNSSTISKKLKNKEFFFTPKGSDFVFFIKKIET
tara:strand:+ start:1954 stop:2175 length:222 start_codon:yes stop_codon:yes gene_type:complete